MKAIVRTDTWEYYQGYSEKYRNVTWTPWLNCAFEFTRQDSLDRALQTLSIAGFQVKAVPVEGKKAAWMPR